MTPASIRGASPEWELVLAATRAALGERAQHPRILDLPQTRLLWRNAAEIAIEHRVAPLVFPILRDTPASAGSTDAMRVLKRAYVANAARNAALFQTLERVLGEFADAAIPIIVLKGAALAGTVYPDRASRPMSDIDVLVHDRDLERAEDRLENIGYRAAHDSETKANLRSRHHHWVFQGGRPLLGGVPLEMHWRLHPPLTPFRVELEGVWQRAERFSTGGAEGLRLAPEDLVLHLCTHAARHHFNVRLISLCDLAAALAWPGHSIDWPRLQARATEWQCDQHVFVVLQLASDLLGAAVTPETLAALRGSGDSPLELALERILEERGAVRAAAELRLRCRRRGARRSLAALKAALSTKTDANPRSEPAAPSNPFSRFGAVVRRYLPMVWPLFRHPRRVIAVAEREARKLPLDSWCSPPGVGSDADSGDSR